MMHSISSVVFTKRRFGFASGQEIGALVKMHVFHLWNKVIFGNSSHPLLAHMTQSLVPQLTGIVGGYIHFFPTYPGVHQVQNVDLLCSTHD